MNQEFLKEKKEEKDLTNMGVSGVSIHQSSIPFTVEFIVHSFKLIFPLLK